MTSTARTKGPSSDSSRGWIVKTSDGKLLTTGTTFPAPREDQKLEFTCPGELIVVSEPERRIRGKTTLKSFLWKQAHQLLSAPSEIDQMSKHYLEDDRTDPESVAKVIRAAAAQLAVSSRDGSVSQEATKQLTGAWCDNRGGYSHAGVVGITNLSQNQPCTTQLLVSWARSRTTCPFAAVEVRANLPLPMSRDLQCLSGTCQIIIPVEPGSMTIWCQGRGDILKEVRLGVTVRGGMISVKPGQPIEVLPQLRKQVDLGNAPATYLICSTPTGLHKLAKGQRDALLAAGFSCLPSGQGEFWSVQPEKGLLQRHHPNPRRGLFNPATCSDLPVPLECIGNLRHTTQQLADGTTQTSMQWWRDRCRTKISAKWTGTTAFQLNVPAPACC